MATTANASSKPYPVDHGADELPNPFISSAPSESQRHRYSGFDKQQFSLYSNGSPSQARRALEAYLAETERRLAEASQLGTVLVQQRKDLAEKLKEVNRHEDESDIGPELRQKLTEVEREFHDVGRDTARAFIAKPRVPSGENPESMGNASVFSTDTQHSPSKLHAPSRKQRNQAPSRANDVKLATEISSALLDQVRELQAAYAEKDEALKSVNYEKSQLEVEVEGLMQRLRVLDESEQRYKDENWSLETQLQELHVASKASSDREHRLTQNLAQAKAEKSSVEQQFEELKQVHGKISEDFTTAKKQHETEISGLRKNADVVETERGALHRKIDELTSQNKELARAMAFRFQAEDQDASMHDTSDNDDTAEGRVTPEHSPPPSPSKATPRHGHLESETLKSSLHHAHRMIQNLKNNIHREKTEKLELKRMLQDARDELESRRRGDHNGLGSAGKKRKNQDNFKKPPRPDRLGAARTGNAEVIMDDEDWEDNDDAGTPSRSRAVKPTSWRSVDASEGTTTDAFETATEHSDAFETANERGDTATETEAFQTGAETLDGDSSDDGTETESGIPVRSRRPPLSHQNRSESYSYHSTASTSGDEIEEQDVRTPVQSQHPRYRLKISRGGFRKGSGRSANDPYAASPGSFKDSPASIGSNASPANGQSLFQELGNLSGGEDDDESFVDGTPSRSTGLPSTRTSPELVRGKSPLAAAHALPESISAKLEMTDSGMMTDQWEPEAKSVVGRASGLIGAAGSALAGGIGFGLGRSSKSADEEGGRPLTASSFKQTAATGSQTSEAPTVPVHLSFSSQVYQESTPVEPTIPLVPISNLQPSTILSLHTEPVERTEQKVPPAFQASTISYQQSEPMESARQEGPLLSFSSISQQHTQPVEPAKDAERPSTATRIVPLPTGIRSRSRSKSPTKGAPPIIAEDETSQPARATTGTDNNMADLQDENARPPFRPIDANALPSERSAKRDAMHRPKPLQLKRADESTQTIISSSDIDKLFSKEGAATSPVNIGRPTSPARSPRKFQEAAPAAFKTSRRPGSAGSGRSRAGTPPPLPPDHKEAIAAAAQKAPLARPSSLSSPTGTMGPPAIPASAYKTQLRPRTPSNAPLPSPTYRGGTATIRPNHRSGVSVSGASGVSSPVTRRSSVSSFASEIDARFNFGPGRGAGDFDAQGIDPRMIQAITQTMIGEFLWKYTRKAGREEISGSRHRRFFWVHPYTRTLYWSEQDPAQAGRKELKAKSVQIEAVRVVTDDNPHPPGLHRKSIVVITQGRNIVFTAQTSQRHETWLNALSYLLLRNSADREEEANAITSEDVDEFNPATFGRSVSRMTGRSRASVMSYKSGTSRRASSPQRAQSQTVSHDTPSLAKTQSAQSTLRARNQPPVSYPQGSVSGRLSSLGSVFRSQGSIRSFSSRHSRQSVQSQVAAVHDPEVAVDQGDHESAEDLRKVIERQEREAHRLENVRACCDGKHDVANLTTRAGRGSRTSRHSHGHSVSSRSQSRTASHPVHEMDPANIAQ